MQRRLSVAPEVSIRRLACRAKVKTGLFTWNPRVLGALIPRVLLRRGAHVSDRLIALTFYARLWSRPERVRYLDAAAISLGVD